MYILLSVVYSNSQPGVPLLHLCTVKTKIVKLLFLIFIYRDLLFALHVYNKGTTLPHMEVGSTHWNLPHVRGCCAPVVLL
jgi:hypothetical protein